MNLLLKCVVEYMGALIIALSVFYESSPLLSIRHDTSCN